LTGSEPGRAADDNCGVEPLSATPSQSAGSPPTPETAISSGSDIPSAPEGDAASESEAARRRILIGSQRDPAAYRARRQRDWVPVEGEGGSQDQSDENTGAEPAENAPEGGQAGHGDGGHRRRHRGGRGRHDRPQQGGQQHKFQPGGPQNKGAGEVPQATAGLTGTTVSSAAAIAPAIASLASGSAPVAAATPISRQPSIPAANVQDEALRSSAADLAGADLANLDTLSLRQPLPLPELEFPQPVPRPVVTAEDNTPVVPGRRQKLSATMQAELDRAMGGLSLDDLMSGGEGAGQEGAMEPQSRHSGRVVALRRDEVFVEFSGREQGCVPVHSFQTPPQPGDTIEVIVQRFNADEGLYDLSLPGASVELGNWDEVHEGMVVDVQVTGHNTGGLECEVSHIRGFIPVSQIDLYRVEDLAQFVGQRFTCVITDANPSRRNLVLSRRALLEREKEEKKQQFFQSLAPGQVHDGTVRKLMDFGAFVEIGNGVDGLLHISQLSWGRIKHPSEVLQEGQAVRVRIEKIDSESGRIGLSYREMTENPWTNAAGKYLPNTTVRGKVTRLAEFGAFVELEPGIEGLVHISELSHKRVWRASDVVKEGEEIEVLVLNVNPETQRMSLSIRGLSKPEPTKKEKEEAEAESPAASKKPSRRSNEPLRGGLGRSGGEAFGLKW
jgi:small subunit ribosomal protein S1